MQTPLISIIVPVYNVREYIEDCLISLQKQNYPKIEIIIIDDGSTDGSGVFCDEFAKREPRMKVIHQENAGLSAARNRGLRESHGEYLTFVDSDDLVEPDYVQYLFNLINQNQTNLSVCPLKEITSKGKIVNYGADYSDKLMSTEEALGRMLREEGFTVVAYAKMYHRSLWQGITFPENALHEDLAITYRLVMKCPKIAFGSEPKYIYRKRKNSISSSEFSDQKFSIITFTDQMCDAIEAKFPYLINTTNLRRMHARFSVLRQLVSVKDLTHSQQAREKDIIKYLKTNKKFITKNPYAHLRDKLALHSLMLGKKFFKIAWCSYEIIRP